MISKEQLEIVNRSIKEHQDKVKEQKQTMKLLRASINNLQDQLQHLKQERRKLIFTQAQ
jgi:TATA-binding protein-associated factor Taf7